jgi:prepilin-type N-terminal cleavage/methylation domain-containing protein/prepilin-type processing-associated H-X9-DG protein
MKFLDSQPLNSPMLPATRRGQFTHRAFTLIELLVTMGILAILVTLVIHMLPNMQERGRKVASLNNLRQIGAAVLLYASDNDNRLPRRVQSSDKWPRLLHTYLNDVKVYAAPGQADNFLNTDRDPLSNDQNNTSYIMNGYDDLGTLEDEDVDVRLTNIDKPGQVILLGTPRSDSRHFYMDVLEGDQESALNLNAYGRGSNYLFADGSARFIEAKDHTMDLWFVDKEFQAN